LRGRQEGFYLVFATALGGWWAAGLWWWFSPGLSAASLDHAQSWTSCSTPMWMLLAVVLVGGKLAVTGWALIESWRRRHITWRFAAVLVSGWLGILGGLIWLMPEGLRRDPWNIVGLIALVPLARLAVSPLAVAANRHR